MFLPLIQPPALPPIELSHRVAIVRPVAAEPAPQPDVRPQEAAEPVEIRLLNDTGPATPDWRQQFSIRINRGGSLTDAAQQLWGDPSEENVNRLFEAARKKYPTLDDPGRLVAGQEFTIEIDPTRSFILADVKRLQDPERSVRTFTNGAVETRYAAPQRGITRVIDFPTEGDREFEFHDGKEAIRVASGSTLINYEYQQGETLEDVVFITYGQRSVTAMADFSAKTGWRPQNWPPEPGTSKQIVLSRETNYADPSIEPRRVTVADPAWQQAINRLTSDRTAAGVFAVETDADSTRYRVRVIRPDVTVADVADLLYERPKDHFEAILKAARIAPSGQVAPPESSLQGASLELDVPYLSEPILLRDEKEFRLASGARLVGEGRSFTAYYPSGYREVRYRPDPWIAFLATTYQLAWESLRDPGAPKEVIEERAAKGTAEVLWLWDPSNPRRTIGDVAESLAFHNSQPGRIAPGNVEVAALLKPGTNVTREERLAATFRQFPFLIPLIAIIDLAVVAIVLSLIYRIIRGRHPGRLVFPRHRLPAHLRPGRS